MSENLSSRAPRVLILGYGNPGRQDDGLGPAAVAKINDLTWSNLSAFDNYQLAIEDAADIAVHDVVWFIDAAKTGPEPFAIQPIAPAPTIEFTSHVLSPESVLAITAKYYGATPQAFMLAIRGYEFEFIEALTPAARDNLHAALSHLTAQLHAHRVML